MDRETVRDIVRGQDPRALEAVADRFEELARQAQMKADRHREAGTAASRWWWPDRRTAMRELALYGMEVGMATAYESAAGVLRAMAREAGR